MNQLASINASVIRKRENAPEISQEAARKGKEATMFYMMFRDWFDLSFSDIGRFSRATWVIWNNERDLYEYNKPTGWTRFYSI